MYSAMTPVFGFFGLGTQEIMLLLVLGVLLFGRNLPALGRSLGKTMTEFKRGMNGMEDNYEATGGTAAPVAAEPVRPPQRVTSTAPKFEDTTPKQA